MPLRIDYRYIESHVSAGASVLDLGCGDGTLLAELARRKRVHGMGVDIDAGAVERCVARGVPVYHGDMLEAMGMFADGTFDCVILSQTLQQTLRPGEVIEQMLRVGRKAIISFPNLGHWQARLQMLLRGRSPVTRALPYQWHDTPNLRALTVRDFLDFCRERDLQIVDRVYFSAGYRRVPAVLANWLAATAVFVLQRRGAAPES